MSKRTLLTPVGLVLIVCLFLLSAIRFDNGSTENISIGLGTPLSITWPFEIAIVGDEGEKGLRIAPKIGRGWLGEAGGEATYSFYAPNDGTYYIWAYALWHDECSNAIFAQIGDM